MEKSIITKIKKIGPASLGIIIPAEHADIMQYNEGDIVEVTITKEVNE